MPEPETENVNRTKSMTEKSHKSRQSQSGRSTTEKSDEKLEAHGPSPTHLEDDSSPSRSNSSERRKDPLRLPSLLRPMRDLERPKPSPQNTGVIEPPPDGGLVAWLQVAGAFFMLFNSWGTINAFGVFQTYYETGILANRSPSDISWIGSMQAFLLLLVGVVSGPLYDVGYFRILITTGSLLVPFGFMMTSLCSQYWQVFLAQGLIIGLGNGCLFTPSVAILPQYFKKKIALATGIAVSGSGLGGVIYPIVFRQLYPRIGFPWATRVLGFLSLATCAFSVAVMKVRIPPSQRRNLLDLVAFKEPAYTVFCLALFFAFIGIFGPIYYIQSYAIQTGITDENLGFYLLPILNAASIFGRIAPNYLSDRIGPINVIIPAALIAGLLTLCWIGIHNAAGIIFFALLFGFFSGAFVSLPPVALARLTPDLRRMGARMGQAFCVASLGLLIGAPVAGEILHRTGSYVGLQLFSGLTITGTGVLLILTRYLQVGWTLRAKT